MRWTQDTCGPTLSRPMNLSLFGIQGSGKGTHAKLLAAEFDYDIYGTGTELRKIAATDTDLGRLVKGYVDSGNLAPVDVVMQVTSEWLDAHEGRKVIFDAIPRSMEQLEPLSRILQQRGRTLMGVHIRLDQEKALQRIMRRSAGRIDDATESSVRRRLQIFRDTTMPVIEWYAQRQQMVEVDGEGSIDDVYDRIKKALAF